MPERNDRPPAAAAAEPAADEFLDDDLDLDELDEPEAAELPDAGPGEPDDIDDDAADALLLEELGPEPGMELGNGHAPLELLEPVDELEAEPAEPGTPDDLAGVELEDADLGVADEPRYDADPILIPAELDARVRRLEDAARALAVAEVARDRKRVRRKVSAATTGAGAIGAIPALLQLAGAFDLDPEIVAAASTVLAAIGAFVAGWATPERKPSLPATVTLDTLSQRR
jgi:hypothetical protein